MRRRRTGSPKPPAPPKAPTAAAEYFVHIHQGPAEERGRPKYIVYRLLPNQEPHHVLVPYVSPAVRHFFLRRNCRAMHRCRDLDRCPVCAPHRFAAPCAICGRLHPQLAMCNNGCAHIFCFECIARHVETMLVAGPVDGFDAAGCLVSVRCPAERVACGTSFRVLMRCKVQDDLDLVKAYVGQKDQASGDDAGKDGPTTSNGGGGGGE